MIEYKHLFIKLLEGVFNEIGLNLKRMIHFEYQFAHLKNQSRVWAHTYKEAYGYSYNWPHASEAPLTSFV